VIFVHRRRADFLSELSRKWRTGRQNPPRCTERRLMDAVKHHALAEFFPLLAGAEFDALVEDIRCHGLREPIITHENSVLDGRNRLRACEVAGVAPRFIEWAPAHPADDPLGFVISANLRRRHLDDGQRALIAERIANYQRGGAGARHPERFITLTQAATMMNVSASRAQMARDIRLHGTAEDIAAVETGEKKLGAVRSEVLRRAGTAHVTAATREKSSARPRRRRPLRSRGCWRQSARLVKGSSWRPAASAEAIIAPSNGFSIAARPRRSRTSKPAGSDSMISTSGAPTASLPPSIFAACAGCSTRSPRAPIASPYWTSSKTALRSWRARASWSTASAQTAAARWRKRSSQRCACQRFHAAWLGNRDPQRTPENRPSKVSRISSRPAGRSKSSPPLRSAP